MKMHSTPSISPRKLPAAWALLIMAGLAQMLLSPQLSADIRLPGFYGDHMVLQQKKPIKLWGWSDANESVTATIGNHSATASANAQGKWQLELPAMDASDQAHTLTLEGKNSIELRDILIGEVWLCSGQSNMEWSVQQSSNATAEIAAAQFPLIRHIKIAHRPSNVALDDVKSSWQLCSPETVPAFTACGYFMARHLHEELNVPIGLINSSWGGTRVEPWTPPVGFQKVDSLQDIYQSVITRTPGNPEYKKQLTAHIDGVQQWLTLAKQAVNSLEPLGASPAYPASLTPFKSHQDPTMLYNGMIHPLVGFPIRGAIWYQGESNMGEGMLYFEKKKALIHGWRELWGQGDFPFYFVQIAPFNYGGDPKGLAEFWEAQSAVTSLSNTGMVVINDIATVNNIHPPNKQDVGLRLANLALKNDYGQSKLVATSPEFDSTERLGRSLKVKFKNTGGGLKTRNDKAPTHFEIIGPGSDGFQPAKATIAGDSVMLKSNGVNSPTAFRFAWHKLAEPNLCGGTGLPVSAVRGGQVPKFTDTLPLGSQYKLVYEIDLARLSADIKYDVDHSKNFKRFDRVGYLVELDSTEFGPQAVFVTMNAFTDDVKKIGIPTVASQAHFQQQVDDMEVYSSLKALQSGKIATGNIEFWPNNYGKLNSNNVNGASVSIYDFGDEPTEPQAGYGCMQIHNFGAKQTLFAINHWRVGAQSDIGIGNSKSQNSDWTFTQNASKYSSKKLSVFVRPKE